MYGYEQLQKDIYLFKMKNIFFTLALIIVCLNSFASEPANNLGTSLYSMKQKFPELRFLSVDPDGELYQDGYTLDGIGTYFIFKDNMVTEECMVCKGTDEFPYTWYNAMVLSFSEKYYSNLKTNTLFAKQFVFSTFNINITYSTKNGTNTAMIIYQKRNALASDSHSTQRTQTHNYTNSVNTSSVNQKLTWQQVECTEDRSKVKELKFQRFFSASSSPKIFGSRSYYDAYLSALKKIRKKAAKKGIPTLLIVSKSGLNTDFLTVKVKAAGYK